MKIYFDLQKKCSMAELTKQSHIYMELKRIDIWKAYQSKRIYDLEK